MMASAAAVSTYDQRRGRLETYFDRTAAKTWERLTSDAPVSGIRATVRAGRDRMRATLLSWLPDDMTGLRLLDAGCGTGALAVEAAKRGAAVVAIDVAGNLIDVARQRAPKDCYIDWRVGDMSDPALGRFDHVVAMDSLIHYCPEDIVGVLRGIADRTDASLLFTVAPSTAPLEVLHAVGKLFPRADRAPAIEPVRDAVLRRLIAQQVLLARIGRDARIASSFYKSHAMEILPR